MKTAKKHIYSYRGKYEGYTLIEMLVVMAIFVIFVAMSFSSFSGLQNTIKMNEYSLTLEQNITNVQRASMLLEKKADDNWLYGLGIDLTKLNLEGHYDTFKWCSPFTDYGDVTTKSYIPSFNPALDLESSLNFGKNGYIPIPTEASYAEGTCKNSTLSSIVSLVGYKTSLTPPKGKITTNSNPFNNRPLKYLVFESVSGRAFFYDETGRVVNYDAKGRPVTGQPINLVITIDPDTNIPIKEIVVENLSGRISTIKK